MLRTTYIYIHTHTHNRPAEQFTSTPSLYLICQQEAERIFSQNKLLFPGLLNLLILETQKFLLHHRAHFPSPQLSTHLHLTMPQAAEMQVCCDPKATQPCLSASTANLTYPLPL